MQTRSTGESCIRLICHLSIFKRFANCFFSHIYIFLALNAGSWMATWKESILWNLVFINKYCWWGLLRVKLVCYYLFVSSSPCHGTYLWSTFASVVATICGCYSKCQSKLKTFSMSFFNIKTFCTLFIYILHLLSCYLKP